MTDVPLERSYWVEKPVLLAGVYAGAPDRAETPRTEGESLRIPRTASASTRVGPARKATATPCRKCIWCTSAIPTTLRRGQHHQKFAEGAQGFREPGERAIHNGDTDTNAAICGALLGAVHGVDAVPEQWRRTLLACRPEAGRPGVTHTLPADFWPVDALELAAALVGADDA